MTRERAIELTRLWALRAVTEHAAKALHLDGRTMDADALSDLPAAVTLDAARRHCRDILVGLPEGHVREVLAWACGACSSAIASPDDCDGASRHAIRTAGLAAEMAERARQCLEQHAPEPA